MSNCRTMKPTQVQERKKWPIRVKRGAVPVNLYRQRNGAFTSYVIAYHIKGTRFRKSRGDLATAITEAKNIASQLEAEEHAPLKEEDCIIYLRALKHIRPSGVSLFQVTNEYAEAFDMAKGSVTIVEAMREYVRIYGLP